MKKKTSSRIKRTLAPLAIISRDDAEMVMTELAQATNSHRQLIDRVDAEFLAIKERYAPQLAAYSEAIKEKTDQLEAWAIANPQAFPKGRKSIALISGTIGFRTGQLKLALMRRVKWETALAAAIDLLPNFIRMKPELDKESIIAQHTELEPNLSHCGLTVCQDESFFVDPDLSAFEPRITKKQEAA
jgi:phage host-nuclease inhibitor protein Gam